MPGEPLDFFQDVRAEHDDPALLALSVQQIHHVQPLARVHAVERLVQQHDLGVVHERRGHLDALPHALGVGRDLPVLRVGHFQQVDRPPRGAIRIGQAVQPRGRRDELGAGQERVDRVTLRHERHLAEHIRVDASCCGPPR